MTPNEKPASPTQGELAVKVKPMDLSMLLRDAFLSGRGLADGGRLSDEDQAAWMAYDPEQMLAYKRITAALSALDRTTLPPAEGWQPMDSAPRDGTVINVVARYPDATSGFPRYAAFLENPGGWFELSRNAPEPIIPWAWRPRDEWPMEPAAPQGSLP